MSVIRPPGSLPPVPTPSVKGGPDARAAFFQSALKAANASPGTPAVTKAPVAPAPQVQRLRDEQQQQAPQPQRYLRPGSLLDIKV